MDMYCCGFNGFGQLGTNSIDKQFSLCKLQNVTDVNFSFSNAIVFSESGVFISGFVGQKANELKKLESPGNGKILFVSSSSKQTLVLMDDGECWQYLSDAESWKKLPHFICVEKDEDDSYSKEVSNQIVKVSCGDTINIALDYFGRVFSIPSPLTLDRIKIVDIACGFEHCVLLDEGGVIYTWGSGTRGQLGHGDTEFEDLPPRKVELLCGLRISKISAGGWHSAVVTDSGDLYTWGWNNSGQLGFPMTKSNLRSINQYKKSSEQINEEYNMTLQQAIRSSTRIMHRRPQNLPDTGSPTISSSLVQNNEETLSTVSDTCHKKIKLCDCVESSEKLDENLQKKENSDAAKKRSNSSQSEDSYCGDIAVAVLPEPWAVDFPSGIDVNVIDVSCGNRHTIALLDDGSVWGCGWNGYCQLGKPNQELLYSSQMIQIPIPYDPKIAQSVVIRCGAWNTALLVKRKSNSDMKQ